NILSILRTDLVDLCGAIIGGTLDRLSVEFEPRATVCKYVVPEGYPDRPRRNEVISLARVPPQSEALRYYLASVEERGSELYRLGSRTIGFVGIGDDLDTAESIAEEAASSVGGPVFHRKDIGTRALVQQRCDHVRSLLGR